jgi:ABC-type glycerol-3-phosphate transport system substrate-binding protein
MREQIERLTKLTTDLLDLSQLDAGAMVMVAQPVDLGELAREVTREFAARADLHGSRLELRTPARAPIALGDPDRVRQIIRILLDNALKHTPEGTKVTVNSATALQGLEFLVNGFRQGWIPRAALSYEEESAQNAFASGKFLFLDNWPDVYAALSAPGPQNTVYGKFGIAALPGPDGMGSSSLGGANLAISAYSQHQRTALDFIKYMTNLTNERQMLEKGSFPPVWTRLYTDRSLIRSHPYLPVLEQAINSARPRPAITNYDQASLAISSTVYEALTQQKQPQQALTEMAGQLTQIIRDG